MGERILYLIRHGQYEQNHAYTDELGGGLTELGNEQAWLVAQALSPLPFKAIYTSPLRRAVETAEVIAGIFPGIARETVDTLREIIPAIPAHEAEFFARHFPELTHEKTAADRKIADCAYDRFFVPAPDDDVHEVLVCHGNIIRYFVCRVLHVQADAWASMEVNNAGITCCTISPQGRTMLASMNDIGHLPHHARTFM